MLMPVKKIEETVEKDASGAPKKIPGSDKPLLKRKIVSEAVDVNLVRAVRAFHKTPIYMKEFPNDEMSVIYIRSSSESRGALEVRVIGNWEDIYRKVNELRGYKQPIPEDSEITE